MSSTHNTRQKRNLGRRVALVVMAGLLSVYAALTSTAAMAQPIGPEDRYSGDVPQVPATIVTHVTHTGSPVWQFLAVAAAAAAAMFIVDHLLARYASHHRAPAALGTSA